MAYLQCDSPDVEKLLSYLVHFNGCFLHGSSDHLFKSLDHEKLLPQFMHLNGFSPLWFLSWIVMWKSSWYFHGFFPSFLPSYVERLRIAQRCLMLRTTYGKPAPVRIWTGKREIWDHFNHLEVPRIPKSHNTCGFLQKPGRSWLSKLLDSLLYYKECVLSYQT